MKPLLALLFIFSLSHADIQVTELFRAETPEELEAALADGYPMPWLAEILADSTIPEEDRYWLDCRMRAAIACNLHLFYDREGNPVRVDAEWMAPGEDYWQEHIMVNILEDAEIEQEPGAPLSDFEGMLLEIERLRNPPVYSPDRPAMMSSDPGLIMNLFGERVGELAVVNNEVELSRDASVGAIQSGGNEALEHRQRQPFACFLYPDGSFLEIPFDSLGRYRAAVSADGSTIAFVCTEHAWSNPHEAMLAYDNHPPDDVIIDAYVFDGNGRLRSRVHPDDVITNYNEPEMSPTGRMLCVSTWGGVGVISCINGNYVNTVMPIETGKNLNNFHLSPDGEYLCAAGYSPAFIVDLKTLDTIWLQSENRETLRSVVTCSRAARVIALTTLVGDYAGDYSFDHDVFLDGKSHIFSCSGYGRWDEEMIVSPEGSFLLIRKTGDSRSFNILDIERGE
ncbi:MAG: hypothetical protein GX465_18720 [Acidobacteria bacterium]|nr:hypothetical protein [Acidobacteriota bacterium]